MPNIKILVCCHNTSNIPDNEIFMPIHVGKAISREDLHMQGDDVGDNISAKNKTYCELTGLYWAWKNLKNVDYIGLCHYRRYFDFRSKCTFLKKICKNDFERVNLGTPVPLLESCDIILAKREYYPWPLCVAYSYSHYSEDYLLLKKIIEESFPAYSSAFCDVMEKDNKFSPCNMFVTSWAIFNDYCEWLFLVLGEVEKKVNLNSYSVFQSRIFGYMAERLLNVYVYKNKLRVKRIPVLFVVDENKIDNHFFRLFYNRMKFQLSFFFQKNWF